MCAQTHITGCLLCRRQSLLSGQTKGSLKDMLRVAWWERSLLKSPASMLYALVIVNLIIIYDPQMIKMLVPWRWRRGTLSGLQILTINCIFRWWTLTAISWNFCIKKFRKKQTKLVITTMLFKGVTLRQIVWSWKTRATLWLPDWSTQQN